MQVIYHHRTMGRSSQGIHICNLVEALEAGGDQVTILSPPGIDPRKTAGIMPFLRTTDRASGFQRIWRYVSCQCHQIVFECCELLYNLLLPFRLLPILWRQPDAVFYERHAYFMFTGVLLAKWHKRTVILEVNELSGFKRARGLVMERLARWIDHLLFSQADHVLCVSSVLAEEAQRRGAKRERTHVVPNAVDPKQFQSVGLRQALRYRLGLSQSIVIGHVGLFTAWDRLDMLVEVVKEVREVHPKVKLLLLGDGPEMEHVKQVAHQLGMRSALIVPGAVPRDEVPAYIDAMDICVLPDSNVFGSPIALFEFMAMGKPSVVPDLHPMRDVIDHDLTGIIFPRGDYGALKEDLLRLVEDPELRTQIGLRAQRVTLERHTWASNARFVAGLVTGNGSHCVVLKPLPDSDVQTQEKNVNVSG
jgi:glycosyltransferase involved in cell wall biosynthesis